MPAADAAATIARHERRPTSNRAAPNDRPYCTRCHQEWLGDATTGGCTAVLLARQLVDVRASIESRLSIVIEERDDAEGRLAVATARAAQLTGLLREALPFVEDVLIGGFDVSTARLLCRINAALAPDDASPRP